MRSGVIADTIGRAVERTVVDDKNLDKRVPAADISKYRVKRGREALFLVIGRDNNRERLQVQIIA